MLKYISILVTLFALVACNPKTAKSTQTAKGTKTSLSEEEQLRLTSFYIDAQGQRMLGNFEKAETLLLKCQDIDPNNHAVLYDRAQIARERGAGSEALILIEQAMTLAPSNMWYQLLAADLYVAKGDFSQAEKSYEKVIRENPQAFDFTYDLSMVRYRNGDINGAIDALDDILEKNGFSEEIFQQKQLLYRESGQPEKAIQDLEEKIAQNPTEPLYYGMLAELYTAMGENDKAMENYEKILEFDPDNGMVQMSLFDHFMKNGEEQKAMDALMRGFEDDVIDIDSKMNLLLGVYERSEVDVTLRPQALDLAALLVQEHPDDAKSHSIYGDFLLRDERYEEARSSFRIAAELDPSKHVIWTQILLLDSELEDFEGMAADSELAVELFPADPSFYLFSGHANTRLGNHEEAIEMLEAGKEMVFDDDITLLEFYSSLGDAYQEVGRHSDSDRILDKALKVKPDNAFVLNNYSYYLALRGVKLDKAESMAQLANELQPGSASFEDTYAWVLYQSGKYPEARIWIEKAIAHGGAGSGEVIEHYGDILYRLNETELAIEKWKEAQILGGHSEELERKITEGSIIE